MSDIDPQIMNTLRGWQNVGSKNIDHAHLARPDEDVEADPPPEDLADRMTSLTRAAELFRVATRPWRKITTQPPSDKPGS